MQENLKHYPDLHRIGKRFQREKANLQDVIRVYQVSKCLPALRDSLFSISGKHKQLVSETFLSKIEEYIESLLKLNELVETTVDLKAADHHEYIIKPDFNPELNEIRSKMNSIQSRIDDLVDRVASNLGVDMKKLKYEVNSQYGILKKG
jgi:DNA mismatch repair protein MSH2